MNLILILLAVFAALFILVKVLEGRAKPMEPEVQSKYARWIMIIMGIILVVQALRQFL